MSESGTFRIRPAGRHLLTIGRDLIKDNYAAVIELVKNAYDADSPNVQVEFLADKGGENPKIVISDHGHGMTRDVVINEWMVPSTTSKEKRKVSPGGRAMQGSKGIGRYAAAVLGRDLLLETIKEGEKTTVYVLWEAFENADHLDDVDVLIETERVSEPQSTTITIALDEEHYASWSGSQFEKLRFELRKLKSPVADAESAGAGKGSGDEFDIQLSIKNFPDAETISEDVSAYPIYESFDYRISGILDPQGKGTLEYVNQKAQKEERKSIQFSPKPEKGESSLKGKPCGILRFDIRVYDREGDDVDAWIERSSKKSLLPRHTLGKLEARRLLDQYSGIGVYRNGFRIRPLGDPGFDWLGLNRRRFLNPTLRISSNQVIGAIEIQSEDESQLKEKSARDGLKEDAAYERLKALSAQVIGQLETPRWKFRRELGKIKRGVKTTHALQGVLSYSEVTESITKHLRTIKVPEASVGKVVSYIDEDAEGKKKIVDELRQTVALYHDQAMLGQVMNIIIHEVLQPAQSMSNKLGHLRTLKSDFIRDKSQNSLDTLIGKVEEIEANSERLLSLIRKLAPLATKRRGRKKPVALAKVIEDVTSTLAKTLEEGQVEVEVDDPAELMVEGWQEDFYGVFVNLVDNSLYWLGQRGAGKRRICVAIRGKEGQLESIDYRDTGPGIEPQALEDGAIFEPHFSTKPNGTGLGLAIASEAATRNGLELRALESSEGAWFKLEPAKGEG